MRIKKILIVILSLILVISMQLMAFAHNGRTDKSGGHRDTKNKSGLGYYHYHCGGYPAHLHNEGVCPYLINTTQKSRIEAETVNSTETKSINVPTTSNVIEENNDIRGYSYTKAGVAGVGAAALAGIAYYLIKKRKKSS